MEVTEAKQLYSLKKLVFILAFVIFVLTLAVVYLMIKVNTINVSHFDELSTQKLTVIDKNNNARVIVSGDVPDPIIRGKSVSRGNTAGGIIIYDQDGDERAGLITTNDANNVMLALDTKDAMTARLAVGPEGGTAFKLFESGYVLEMLINSASANLTVSKDGSVIQQFIETSAIPPQICELFKSGIKSEHPEGQAFPRETVLGACLKRFTADACEPCLPDR